MRLTTVTNVSLDGVTQGHRRIDVVWGSGTLIRWLLDQRLVDQIVLLTYPVVVGQGVRLFPATGQDAALELRDLQSTPKGLTIQTYRVTGRPQYEEGAT